MKDQGIGLGLDVQPAGTEQLCLDRVKARHRIWPRVDLTIELGETGSEHLGALPSDACGDPRFLSLVHIIGENSLTHGSSTGQRTLDFFDGLADNGSPGLGTQLSILWASAYSNLRKTDRFKAYLRKAGFIDYWKARGWPDFTAASSKFRMGRIL